MPLYQQPRFVYDYTSTLDESDDILDDQDFIIGTYFYGDSASEGNHFFSFNYHVNNVLPYVSDHSNNTKNGNVAFVDLALAVKPQQSYRMGIAMISPIRNTTTKQIISYQCTFSHSTDEVYVAADYKWIWSGPHFTLGIPMLIISFLLTSSTFLCCAHKFVPKSQDETGDINAQTDISDPDADSPPQYEPREFLKISSQNLLHSESTNDQSLISGSSLKSKLLLYLRVLWDNARAVFLASDAQIVNVCGSDVYYFNWYQKYLLLYSIVCGCLCMFVLFPLYVTSDDHQVQFSDFASTTIASLNFHTSRRLYVFFVITLLIPIMGCLLLYAIRRLSRTIVKSNNNYGCLYTVMVSNVPSYIRSRQELIEEFSERYGQQHIVDAHICFDLDAINRIDLQITKTESELKRAKRQFQVTNVKPTIKINNVTVDLISQLELRISHMQESLVKKTQQGVDATGYAFVTFSSIEMAKYCIEDHRVFCCGYSFPTWLCESNGAFGGYQITQAPEPTDVLYDNLGYTHVSTRIRQFATNIILLMVLTTLYMLNVIYMYVNWWKAQNYSTIYEMINHGTSNYYGIAFLQVLVELAPEIVSAVNELLRFIVELLTNFEKHHTRIGFRRAVLQKTAFFLTMTTAFLPFFWTWYKGVWQVKRRAVIPFDNYYYFFNALLSQGIISMMVVLWTIAKSIELFIVFMRCMWQLVRSGRMARPEFDYEVASGFKITILFMMLVYGPIAPVFFVFCVLYLLISFFIDKFFIMFLYERCHDSDGQILNHVADQISYYLAICPFYIVLMLPTLLVLKSTWLFYIPGMLFVYVLVRFVKNKSKKEQDQAIIVGLKEQQRHDQELVGDVDSPAGVSDFEDSMERSVRQANVQRPRQSSSWLSNLIRNFGGRSQEVQFSTRDVENLGVDVKKLAQRYKHPYLRRLQRKQEEERRRGDDQRNV
ncbi:11 TM domain-containing transmembrane protein [Acrasis kona]|uniref:11 TM domain-containing transmembrane protein n=1 Tax=Acrasis kona TaxID=1008807 RepID=A0AAW2Z4X3_9EUKA